MDIRHEQFGDAIITLSDADIAMLKSVGGCMAEAGLEGQESSTWIQSNAEAEKPTALVDGSANLHVYLPEGADQLPTQVERSEIKSIYYNEARSQVEQYFGQLGGIVVRAAEV